VREYGEIQYPGDRTLELILFTVALFIGAFVGDLPLRRGLAIYRFGLLTAIKWYREDRLVSVVPVIRYILILLLLTVLFIAITYVVLAGYREYVLPYGVGMAAMFYYGQSKCAAYADNISDFVKYNIEYIKEGQ